VTVFMVEKWHPVHGNIDNFVVVVGEQLRREVKDELQQII